MRLQAAVFRDGNHLIQNELWKSSHLSMQLKRFGKQRNDTSSHLPLSGLRHQKLIALCTCCSKPIPDNTFSNRTTSYKLEAIKNGYQQDSTSHFIIFILMPRFLTKHTSKRHRMILTFHHLASLTKWKLPLVAASCCGGRPSLKSSEPLSETCTNSNSGNL